MIRNIFLFLLWAFIWILLKWPPTLHQVYIGMFVSAFVLFMTIDTLSGPYSIEQDPVSIRKGGGLLGDLLRLPWFLVYVAVFLWECIKANIDVAFRVLHPDLPIRPGTIKVKTRLRSDIGLTFLANSITLTPGTTTVDVDKDNGYIYIHWLRVKDGFDRASQTLPVVEKFEKILIRIFE